MESAGSDTGLANPVPGRLVMGLGDSSHRSLANSSLGIFMVGLVPEVQGIR